MDETGTLRMDQVGNLSNEIKSYLPALQLQVWIIQSLDGEAIESLSIRAAEKWKLGDAKTDRGALILVAIDDRRMRIEVGQGLEGDIPDALAGRIVDQVLKPAFRNQKYFEGIYSASRMLNTLAIKDPNAQALTQSLNSRSTNRRGGVPIVLYAIVIGLFLLIRLLSFLPGIGSSGMWGRRSGMGGGWSGGGGFGGFGGSGGGWGGGGGGFSGGGSSGSW
jgi:uncharacterized protein